MRRAVGAAAIALAAAPAIAAASPFGELPFRPVGGAATCLAPTGVPGGLVRWTPAGAELLEATAAGLVPQATFALGSQESCPAAAVDASGAGVVAGATKRGIRVAVRDPGGTWGAPVTLPSKLGGGVATAVSARGDVVVAWTEYDAGFRSAHVHIARRAPGAAFGTPQRLAFDARFGSAHVAVTAAGEALAVIADERALRIVSAAAGAEFGAARRLLTLDSFGDAPALAVSPDGRALLAAEGDRGIVRFDRAPGGEFVRRPAIAAEGDVAVALRADGTAIVAWGSEGRVTALRRGGTGPFGPPIVVHQEPPKPPTSTGGPLLSLSVSGGPPIEQPHLAVALGADAALLTWPRDEAGLQAATLTAAGPSEVSDLGSPLRPAAGLTPLVLADGTRVVAWTDRNELLSLPPFAGRLHLAAEGAAPAPVPAAPELTVGAPRDRTLRPVQPLDLPIRCSAACDVRGEIAGRSTAATTSLSRAGTTMLRFVSELRAVAPGRGPLKVTLRWSAPGAPSASTRTVAVRVRRLPAPPIPHLLDVRALRGAGGVVDVRWRTDGPALDAYFTVLGTRTRSTDTDPDPKYADARGGARRRSFHVRLRDAAAVRYVTVAVSQPVIGGRGRTVRVRVQ